MKKILPLLAVLAFLTLACGIMDGGGGGSNRPPPRKSTSTPKRVRPKPPTPAPEQKEGTLKTQLKFQTRFESNTQKGSTKASLLLKNQSSVTLCRLYVWQTGKDGPGQNQTSNSIQPDKDKRLRDIPPGSYNLRVEGCSSGRAERQGVQFKSGQQYTWTITN